MDQQTVLLVEDNTRDVRLIQRAFTQSAFTAELRVVENGEEALAYLHRQGPYVSPNVSPDPQLMLLDLNMPRMGGHEVLRHCQQDSRLKHLPIVVLTTSGRPEDVRQALQTGAKAYLIKPVEVERLTTVMGQIGLFKVDVQPILDRVLRDLQQAVTEAGATVNLPDAFPQVIYPEAQLAQIFSNLISNALKFTADRAPEVTIGCDEMAQHHRFTVQDNGIGVDPQDADRIFDIFQRLAPGETYSGAGVGLTAVKKIVESHGGRIGVEATPGGGSTFWFTIPRAEGLAHAEEKKADRIC